MRDDSGSSSNGFYVRRTKMSMNDYDQADLRGDIENGGWRYCPEESMVIETWSAEVDGFKISLNHKASFMKGTPFYVRIAGKAGIDWTGDKIPTPGEALRFIRIEGCKK